MRTQPDTKQSPVCLDVITRIAASFASVQLRPSRLNSLVCGRAEMTPATQANGAPSMPKQGSGFMKITGPSTPKYLRILLSRSNFFDFGIRCDAGVNAGGMIRRQGICQQRIELSARRN